MAKFGALLTSLPWLVPAFRTWMPFLETIPAYVGIFTRSCAHTPVETLAQLLFFVVHVVRHGVLEAGAGAVVVFSRCGSHVMILVKLGVVNFMYPCP